jgi:hypothetical protein
VTVHASPADNTTADDQEVRRALPMRRPIGAQSNAGAVGMLTFSR